MKNITSRVHKEHMTTTSNVQAETKQAVSHATHSIEKARLLNENNKLVRRYSFDDNGGGYAGL